MAWITRFLVAVAFLAFGIIFSPETFGSKSDGEYSSKFKIALKLCHLLSFSTSWGAALWVTFIGGIIMFKNLPRHQFGNLQSKMFPAYFSMVTVCSAISLASFGYLHPWKSSSSVERYQLGFLISSFAFNVSNLVVFTPMTIELFCEKLDLRNPVSPFPCGLGSLGKREPEEGPLGNKIFNSASQAGLNSRNTKHLAEFFSLLLRKSARRSTNQFCDQV